MRCFTPPHPLCLTQALIYNHAMLSLWGEDAIAIVADLDEYLFIGRPGMSVLEVGGCIIVSTICRVRRLVLTAVKVRTNRTNS